MKSLQFVSLHILCVSLFFSILPAASGKTVKVFILAGQSNMVGMGSLEHLGRLTQDPGEFRTALYNDHGEYKTSENVIVKYGDQVGKLTVGKFAPKGNFGPELMFGFTVGEKTTEPILIIKTAWGGKTLAVDFRPPSAGIGHYEHVSPIEYGHYYRAMIEEVLNTLNNIQDHVPDATDYDLEGFVWFQGWNDLTHGPMVEEYGENLEHLIRDVRLDLNAPDLPFVIGEVGQHGTAPGGRGAKRAMALRKVQKDVTLLPEFQGTTKFVPTASYTVSDGESFNQGYHYYGRADTFFHIGKAMGETMLELIR